MLIAAGPVMTLGRSRSRVRFNPGPSRGLCLDDQQAFLLSHGCGTCQFLFMRADDLEVRALSLESMRERLTGGLTGLDPDVIDAFGQLLPPGEYLPLLLSVTPHLTHPGTESDYFTHEQLVTWGPPELEGPENPETPYYRTFQTRVAAGAHLYEFVVPLVPPEYDDRAQVQRHARRLETSSSPTAVAVSTLDVCAPAVDHGDDFYEHWGLTHFLLDGHHKVHAAAITGRPLQLLSLVAVADSLASAEQVAALATVRAQPAQARMPEPYPGPASHVPPSRTRRLRSALADLMSRSRPGR